jgi:tetratricopeptide (TPR) repeat protein
MNQPSAKPGTSLIRATSTPTTIAALRICPRAISIALIADYGEAIRVDPKYAAGYATAYANRGNAYRANGDLDLAISDFNEAIRLSPKYAKAYYLRGLAHGDRSDLDRAIADYGEAIRVDPKDAAAYVGRRSAYLAKGDGDRALADLGEAIRLNPEHSWVYRIRGIVYLSGGARGKAPADFRVASELDPKNAHSALWLAIAERRDNIASHLPQAAKATRHANVARAGGASIPRRVTPAEVLAAIDHKDPKTKDEQVCQGNLYGGIRPTAGEERRGPALYRAAASSCPKSFIEWAAATAAIRALSKGR